MTTMYELYQVYDRLVDIWRRRYSKESKEYPDINELINMVDELELQHPEKPKIGKPYGSMRFWK